MPKQEGQTQRHLNREEKRALKAADMNTFVHAYARKKRKGGADPNDRNFDGELAKRIKKMKPAQVDDLIRDDEF